MRITVHLKRVSGSHLPVSVNSALQAALYAAVSSADPETGELWHTKMKLKPWTFSDLICLKRAAENGKEGYRIAGDAAKLHVSSPDGKFIFALMQGLTSLPRIQLLSVAFDVVGVQTEISPKFEESADWHRFSALSGYCASKPDRALPFIHFYTDQDEERLLSQLARNAKRTYEAHTGDLSKREAPLEIAFDRSLPAEKSGKVAVYKPNQTGQTKIYANTVPVKARGDIGLIRFIYEAGLGERTSAGFGMLRYEGAEMALAQAR